MVFGWSDVNAGDQFEIWLDSERIEAVTISEDRRSATLLSGGRSHGVIHLQVPYGTHRVKVTRNGTLIHDEKVSIGADKTEYYKGLVGTAGATPSHIGTMQPSKGEK